MTPLSIISGIEIVFALSMSIMGGIYFIFSNTVMASLNKVGNGANVMVELNKVILNPIFMACFVISGIGAAYFIFFGEGIKFWAGLIFLLGTTGVTIVKNVPLNERLRLAEGSDSFKGLWLHYLTVWTRWNHVRTISSVIAEALMMF